MPFKLKILFFLLLGITILYISPKAAESSSLQPRRPKNRGYLVEFKGEPLLNQRQKLKAARAKALPSVIKAEHVRAKNDFTARLGIETTPLAEFSYAFNGLALDLDKKEADDLKNSPYVKGVYPNYEVEVLLTDSIPLIGADKVWELKDGQGRNLTGQGVNAAIIDSGIDTTHPDLGSSPITERPIEKINRGPLELATEYFDKNQLFSLNNNRLAYPQGNTLKIKNFSTGETETIPLTSPDFEVNHLAMGGNIIVYIAGNSVKNQFAIYYYDLQQKVHQKIRDTELFRGLGVSGDKIVYFISTVINNTRTNETYVYDVVTKTEKRINRDGENCRPKISGNRVFCSIFTANNNFKAVMYDIETEQYQEFVPPQLGQILDFKGSKILYSVFDPAHDPNWTRYRLYDLENGSYEELSYPFSDSQNTTTVRSIDYVDHTNKGEMETNLIFFSKDVMANKIIAYDMIQKRYVLINLLTVSGYFEAEGNKVCFLASDFNLYCHLYDPNASYSLPENIYNQKVVNGHNFITNDNQAFDDHGHGTHVAGIVAGNGLIKGVAPDAKLVAYKVTGSDGSGSFSTVISAIETAANTLIDNDPTNDIRVISLSIGTNCDVYDEFCGPDDPLSRAVDNAVEAGVSMVIAAGNSGSNKGTINTPGTARKAITVGAINKSKQVPWFSSRGPVVVNGATVNKPDVVAPGFEICSAEYDGVYADKQCFDNKHIMLSGTSMAAPHVAGLVALMIQAHPDWTPSQIKEAVKSNAVNLGYDIDTQGAGLIDAFKILTTPTPTPVNTCVCSDISVPAKILGNANCDTKINLLDFEIWREEATGMRQTKTADFNCLNNVNQADFDIWKANRE